MFDFTAYLDASGTHKDSRVVGYSGLISTAREWARFTKSWARVLEGPPKMDALHFADFFYWTKRARHRPSHVRDNYGWSNDDRTRVVNGFLQSLLPLSPLYIFGCTMDLDEYESVMPEKIQRLVGSPAVMCLPGCFLRILKWLPEDLALHESVDFIFDQDNKSREDHVAAAFKNFAAQHPQGHRFGGVAFRSRKKFLPLQAADVIAHQEWFGASNGGMVSGLMRAIMKTLPEEQIGLQHLTREQLIDFREGVSHGREVR